MLYVTRASLELESSNITMNELQASLERSKQREVNCSKLAFGDNCVPSITDEDQSATNALDIASIGDDEDPAFGELFPDQNDHDKEENSSFHTFASGHQSSSERRRSLPIENSSLFQEHPDSGGGEQAARLHCFYSMLHKIFDSCHSRRWCALSLKKLLAEGLDNDGINCDFKPTMLRHLFVKLNFTCLSESKLSDTGGPLVELRPGDGSSIFESGDERQKSITIMEADNGELHGRLVADYIDEYGERNVNRRSGWGDKMAQQSSAAGPQSIGRVDLIVIALLCMANALILTRLPV